MPGSSASETDIVTSIQEVFKVPDGELFQTLPAGAYPIPAEQLESFRQGEWVHTQRRQAKLSFGAYLQGGHPIRKAMESVTSSEYGHYLQYLDYSGGCHPHRIVTTESYNRLVSIGFNAVLPVCPAGRQQSDNEMNLLLFHFPRFYTDAEGHFILVGKKGAAVFERDI